MTAVMFNPFEPGYLDDPYAQFATLREHDPVHHSPIDLWLLFRYEDVSRLLRDQRQSVAIEATDGSARRETFEAQFHELFPDRELRPNRSILNVDPPDHTRLRKLVASVFTPRRIEELRPRVQQLVDGMLDEAVAARGGDGEPVDVIAQLAFPLPFAVISEMLGMPEADRDQIREWSGTLVRQLDPVNDPDVIRAALVAGERMFDHLSEVIRWKRSHPGDDLLTALIQAEEDGDALTSDELADQVSLLFIAGHETTVNLIGNGTLALLRHRAQLEALQADPGLDTNAVDELLRFDSPVQFTRRTLVTDLEIDGTTVPAGTFLLAGLASANRDEAFWGPDAGLLDLRRTGAARHLSFSSGIHHCLGAALARLEGQVALGTLVRRFPSLELAVDKVEWNGRINLRGLDALPVALH
jgi:cytochrome P450